MQLLLCPLGGCLRASPSLEKLPLAIEQAAAYIRETGIEITSYLKMFNECERNQQELLEEALPSANQDRKRSDSRAVMTTWNVTIDKIQEKNPRSVQLLESMNFLNPDGIPKSLMRRVPFLVNETEVQFNKAFAPLLTFSLIYKLESSNFRTSYFRLHRLVGLWMRKRIDSEDQQRRMALLEMLFAILKDGFPKDMRGNHIECLQLAAHATAALGHTINGYHYRQTGIQLLNLLGNTLKNDGNVKGAFMWYQRACDDSEKALGEDHLDTLTCAHNIADTFRLQGD